MRLEIPSVLAALTRYRATNAGLVTIVAGGGTSILTLSIPLLVAGQLVFVAAQSHPTKGAVGGRVSSNLSKSAGTATIDFVDPVRIATMSESNVAALEAWHVSLFNIGIVSVTGSYTFNLQGVSAGSDSSEAVGAAEITALVVNR